MQIIFSRKAEKYLIKISESNRALFEKLTKAVEEIAEFKGDIKKMQGAKNQYRYKIYQYRIIFSVNFDNKTIFIQEIGTRGDIYK